MSDPRLVVIFDNEDDAEKVSEHLLGSSVRENVMFIDEENADITALELAVSLEEVESSSYSISQILPPE